MYGKKVATRASPYITRTPNILESSQPTKVLERKGFSPPGQRYVGRLGCLGHCGGRKNTITGVGILGKHADRCRRIVRNILHPFKVTNGNQLILGC